MDTSNLKLYSLGIVVEDKPRGTDFILVSPIETLNIQTPGSIKEYNKDYKGDKKELESTNFKTEHEAKNYLRAKWIPFGHSNRITAPDVIVNETVVLFKFGDVNEYYWTTIFREPELRRLETVNYGFSNVRDGIASKSFDKTTSYWQEVSTHDKYIHIHTSMNDGEPFEYDVVIDTKTGFINMRDNVGNFIELNSPNNAITLRALEVINLDAPIINMRSANGAMKMNEKGVKIEGNEIENNTRTGERENAAMGNAVDATHSRGELSDRKITAIADIQLLNKSKTEDNLISQNINTETTDVTTKATTEVVQINTVTNTNDNVTHHVSGVITNDTPQANFTGHIDADGHIFDKGGNTSNHPGH